MKPPVRARAAPRRYGVDLAKQWMEIDSEIADWTVRDKRLLLRALMRQSASREPDLSSIERAVPGKNREEISAYLEGLRVRSIRSLTQRNYIQRLREKQHRQQQLRAPLQIWTELAEEATGKLGEAIATAFSQTLMIAATEPTSREHSVPRIAVTDQTLNPAGGSDAGVLPGESIPETGSSSQTAGDPVTQLGPTSVQDPQAQDTPVDFGKIYKFLSATVRGVTLPQLSPFESAVVLDLLMTLPDQLQGLSCPELWSHMNRTYRQLNHRSSGWHGQSLPENRLPAGSLPDPGPGPHSPQSPSVSETDRPPTPGPSNQLGQATQDPTAAHTDQSESPHAPQSIQSEPEAKDTAEPGLLESDTPAACPLNPFLIPIRLLARREAPTTSQGSSADLVHAPGNPALSSAQHRNDLVSAPGNPVLTSDQPSADL
ncbi:snRNA-activating protein complex subunit 2 isoform X1 [Heterodontus francisci]|uniref:snRNA-activating protein complex subunit 2 isoform X1 n=1 Tax=Heterodontus francisci TaxID=7792 RepID=UPI00355BDE8E